MRSRMGVITASTRGLRKPQMPTSSPAATPMGTAMMMEDSVIMALSHWPNTAR